MTCDDLMPGEPSRGLVVTPEEMETIELGLVVIVQRERRIADSFQSFVRPRLRGSVQRSPQSSRVPHIQERGLAIRSRAELIDHPSLRFQRCPSLSALVRISTCACILHTPGRWS